MTTEEPHYVRDTLSIELLHKPDLQDKARPVCRALTKRAFRLQTRLQPSSSSSLWRPAALLWCRNVELA